MGAMALGLLLVAGCAHGPAGSGGDRGPFFTPVNHVGAPSLSGIRRVVLLPIWSAGAASSETTAALDAVLLAGLLQQNRFEVVTIGREECRARFGAESFASTAALPRDLFPKLQRDYAAEAVLFVDLTAFHAYHPLTLGLRAKLTTLDHPWLVWAFDEAFSAANPAVANSARRHGTTITSARGAVASSAVLQSPSRFAAFAMEAMFSTLPPVRPSAMTGAVAATKTPL